MCSILPHVMNFTLIDPFLTENYGCLLTFLQESSSLLSLGENILLEKCDKGQETK